MTWADKRTVGGISVYDVPPTKAQTKNNGVILGGRLWKAPFVVKDGTAVEAFCPVGCFSTKKSEMWAVIRMPDGSSGPWHVLGKPTDDDEL